MSAGNSPCVRAWNFPVSAARALSGADGSDKGWGADRTGGLAVGARLQTEICRLCQNDATPCGVLRPKKEWLENVGRIERELYVETATW